MVSLWPQPLGITAHVCEQVVFIVWWAFQRQQIPTHSGWCFPFLIKVEVLKTVSCGVLTNRQDSGFTRKGGSMGGSVSLISRVIEVLVLVPQMELTVRISAVIRMFWTTWTWPKTMSCSPWPGPWRTTDAPHRFTWRFCSMPFWMWWVLEWSSGFTLTS